MSLWNSVYETGNELVDNDHKEIFALVGEVLASVNMSRANKVKTGINFLAEYVVRHFANEERLMDESDYPETAEHKKEHADFLIVATELKNKIDNDTFVIEATDLSYINLSIELNKTIAGWLVAHVMGSDKKLANHYRKWSEEKSSLT